MLSLGLVGLPNAGKSTLFNALTRQNVLVADYPFATIDPTTGVVPIVDDRLDQLARTLNSQRQVPATVTFVDIAGLVKGASQGEGLGNAFLSQIRSMAALAIVLRVFQTPGSVTPADPEFDLDVLLTELRLADYQILDKQQQKLSRLVRGDPDIKSSLELVEAALADLDCRTLRSSPRVADYQAGLGGFGLLTLKPMIYVFNLAAEKLGATDLASQLAAIAGSDPHLLLNAQLEEEIGRLDGADQVEFRSAYGLAETGLDRLKKLGFDALGLQTFLTAGPKEARAWTIRQGCLASQAAGVIHSDFEAGFIAADIIDWADLVAAGSWAAARTAGRVRTEGRSYILLDGEVAEFKFSPRSTRH